MTSTTSQRQGYDFHEAPPSLSQFPEPENQVPRSLSQFSEQKMKNLYRKEQQTMIWMRRGRKILHITCEIKAGVL